MRLIEVHIEVTEVDRSLEFYSTLLPHKKIVHWKDKSAAALVFDNGSAFGIWRTGKKGIHNGRGGRHVHFAFQIQPGEYEQYRNQLEKLGAEALEHVWPSGERSVYFFDPDGHQGEFITCDWCGLKQTADI